MFERILRSLLPTLSMALILVIGYFALSWHWAARYRKVNGQWAWVGHNMGVGRYEIKFVSDPDLFVVLDDPRYAKDQLRVFYEGRPIPGADPASFVVLRSKGGRVSQSYAKDKARVFLEGYLVPRADPDSFEFIEALYARDKMRVYCGTVPMEGSDPGTFLVMRQCELWDIGYVKGIPFEIDSDFADLEVSQSQPAITTSGCWAKDANRYYWDAAVIKGADYDTFHAVETPRGAHMFFPSGRDKDHEYLMAFRKEDYVREWEQRAAAQDAKRQKFLNEHEATGRPGGDGQ